MVARRAAGRPIAGRRVSPRRLALSLALSVVATACTKPTADTVAGPSTPPGPATSVLLVSVDTLRADFLPQATFLSSLASSGRVFSHLYASSNWTLPAHVSLFTSLPYQEHDLPPAGSRGAHAGVRIPASWPTLATALRDAGYATAATTEGGWMAPRYGLAAGFDRFETVPGFSLGATAPLDRHLELADEFVRTQRERPFFLFVHTYCVHDYFVNSAAYHPLLTDEDSRYAALGDLLKNVPPAQRASIPPEFVRRLYAAGVQLADRFLEDLVRTVRAASDDRPLLALVTSDHGESLGEGGVWGHGSRLSEEQLRIFLVAWSHRASLPSGVLDQVRSTVDIAPSVLRWLGVPIPRGFRGATDLLSSSPQPPRSPALSLHHRGHGDGAGETVTHQALIWRDRKLLHSERPDGSLASQECLDRPSGAVRRDAECGELARIFPRIQELNRKRRQALPSVVESVADGREEEVDPKTLEELRALGYLH